MDAALNPHIIRARSRVASSSGSAPGPSPEAGCTLRRGTCGHRGPLRGPTERARPAPVAGLVDPDLLGSRAKGPCQVRERSTPPGPPEARRDPNPTQGSGT